MCIIYSKNVLSSTNTEHTYVSALFQNITLYFTCSHWKEKEKKPFFFFLSLEVFLIYIYGKEMMKKLFYKDHDTSLTKIRTTNYQWFSNITWCIIFNTYPITQLVKGMKHATYVLIFIHDVSRFYIGGLFVVSTGGQEWWNLQYNPYEHLGAWPSIVISFHWWHSFSHWCNNMEIFIHTKFLQNNV